MATSNLDFGSLTALRALSARIAEQNGGRAPNGCDYRALERLTKTGELRSVKIANATVVKSPSIRHRLISRRKPLCLLVRNCSANVSTWNPGRL